MGTKSSSIREEAKRAAQGGADCFDMSLIYLRDKSYCGRVVSLEEAEEGDLLVFTGKDGVSLVIAIGNGRGYSVAQDGRAAILRFADLLIDRQFLAGVRVGG